MESQLQPGKALPMCGRRVSSSKICTLPDGHAGGCGNVWPNAYGAEGAMEGASAKETAKPEIFSQIRSVVDRLQALDAARREQRTNRISVTVDDGPVRGELNAPNGFDGNPWILTLTASVLPDKADAEAP